MPAELAGACLCLRRQACSRQKFVSVSLYDTLGPQAIEYIIQHAQIAVVLTQSDRLAALTAAVKAVGVVKHVVYWGKPDPDSAEVRHGCRGRLNDVLHSCISCIAPQHEPISRCSLISKQSSL